MLIYSPAISPRLKYTLDLVFQTILHVDFRLTDSKEELISHKGACLNYSNENIKGIPFLEATSLLFEESISDQSENIKGGLFWDGLPGFFPVGKESLIPFDIFAAAFYLVSRYEEYLPFQADKHNRFHSELGLASKMNFLDEPLVDKWIIKLGKILEIHFPKDLKIQPGKFTFEATIDIDNAWAFKNKGILRTLGAVLKSGQSMERRNYRYQALRGKQQDPYDQYRKMEMLHAEYGFSPHFFFLVGPYGKFDKNISPKKTAFRKLIRDISNINRAGLHPSYASFNDPTSINHEKNTLEQITGKKIKSSRQHYLRLRFPLTYQTLIQAGINNEYSMAYADRSGFRASIAQPFYFFDLVNNKETELRVFPFQVMDTGLKDYEKCSPEQAIERIRYLMEQTREVGGRFSSLWHNESFSEWEDWKGWTAVYREMLNMAGKNI